MTNPEPKWQWCPTHPPMTRSGTSSSSSRPFNARIGAVSTLVSVKVDPAPINESRPTTHSCRQVFCAIIVRSITVVMNKADLKGKKQPSPTTLMCKEAPWAMVTLLPIIQASMTTPAPISTLSPMIAGPVILAVG